MRICKTCFEKKEIERFEKTDGYYRHKCKDCANAKRRTGKTRSSFPKGHIPWNKGKRLLNEKTRALMSQAHLGKPSPRRGATLTKETKSKIRASLKRWLSQHKKEK